MSAEPLSRKEREAWIERGVVPDGVNDLSRSAWEGIIYRYEATVQEADEDRDAAEKRAERLRAAIIEALDEFDARDEGCPEQYVLIRALAADDAARGEG